MQSSGHGNRSKEDSENRMGRKHTVRMTSEKTKPVEQQGHIPRNSTMREQTQTPLLQAANSMQIPSQNPPMTSSGHERLLPEVTLTLPSLCQPTLLRRIENLSGKVPLQSQNPPASPTSNKRLVPVSIKSALQCPTFPARQKHLLPAVNEPLDPHVALIFPKSNEELQLRGKRQLDAHQTFTPPRFKASLLPVNNAPEARSAHILPKPRSQLPAVSASPDSQRLPTPVACGNIIAQETVEVSIKVGSQESHILCSGSERPLSPIHFRMTSFSMPLTSRQDEMIRLAVNEVLQIQLLHVPPTLNAKQLIIYNTQPRLQQHPTLSNRVLRPMATDNASVHLQHMNAPSKSSERPPPTNTLRSTSNSNSSIQRLPLIPNLEILQTNMRNPSIRSMQSLDSTAIQYRELPAEMNNPNCFPGRQESTQRAICFEPSDEQEVARKSEEGAKNSIPVTEEQLISHPNSPRTLLAMFQALTLMEQNLLSHRIRLDSEEQRLLFQELVLSEERRLLSLEIALSQERRPLLQERRPLLQERRPLLQERRPLLQERRPLLQEQASL